MKKFNIKITRKRENTRSRNWFWSLACLLFVLSTLYVYYVNTAAMNGVRWKEAVSQARVAESAISELEATYLSQKRTVTLALASELGFAQTRPVRFLSEQPIEVSVR